MREPINDKAIEPVPAEKKPLGRPKNPISKSVKLKEDLIDAYYKAGGVDRLIRLISELKLGKSPTKEKRAEYNKRNQRFWEYIKILSTFVPKQVEQDIETRVLVFHFDDQGKPQAKDEDIIDIKLEENKGE